MLCYILCYYAWYLPTWYINRYNIVSDDVLVLITCVVCIDMNSIINVKYICICIQCNYVCIIPNKSLKVLFIVYEKQAWGVTPNSTNVILQYIVSTIFFIKFKESTIEHNKSKTYRTQWKLSSLKSCSLWLNLLYVHRMVYCHSRK